MSRIITFMARHRPLWLVWMFAGTPLMLAGFILDVLWTTVSHLYATWHWRWKADMQEWFSHFGERHRRSLRSLGMKPETRR